MQNHLTFQCQSEHCPPPPVRFSSITPVNKTSYLRTIQNRLQVRNSKASAAKRSVTELFRGDEIVNTASVDYWDFDQNGAAVVRQKPYKLKKGDNYHTTCYFESYKNDTKFGEASSEEMCMALIYYYPKQSSFINCGPHTNQTSCNASYSSSTLASDSFFDRAMTDTTSTSGAPTT